AASRQQEPYRGVAATVETRTRPTFVAERTRHDRLRRACASFVRFDERQRFARLLDHRRHGRILDAALDGDRVELRVDAVGEPDAREAVLAPELRLENRGDGRESVTRARELTQHR